MLWQHKRSYDKIKCSKSQLCSTDTSIIDVSIDTSGFIQLLIEGTDGEHGVSSLTPERADESAL